jgi:hypothetical protein
MVCLHTKGTGAVVRVTLCVNYDINNENVRERVAYGGQPSSA